MMKNLSDDLLAQIAQGVIAGFLAQFGMTISEESLEVRDYDFHRVFTVQSQVPTELEESIDSYDMFQSLSAYLQQHNKVPTAVPFQPYDVSIYVCTCDCGKCGTFCFTSICHTA